MTQEFSLDLSGPNDHFDTHLRVVTTIANLLIDSADADQLDETERELLRGSMDEIATIILAEIGLTIVSVEDNGTINATLDLGEFSE